jgi:hypothetical protein
MPEDVPRRLQHHVDRFLSKQSGRNDWLDAYRQQPKFVKFQTAIKSTIAAQLQYVADHLDEIKIWDSTEIAPHQIEARIGTYLDQHMPTFASYDIGEAVVYDNLLAAFEWSVVSAYERLGVKVIAKAADYTTHFELTNEHYIAALKNSANYLLTTKSKGYDDTTKARLITTVRDGRLANDTVDEVASDLAAKVDGISSVRAMMISVTETANAFGTASQAYLDENNIPQKEWVIAGPHPVEDECDDNEDASPIPSDQEFPSGDMAEPAHIGCECYTNGVGLDLTTMSDSELDSLVLWDGS